MKIAIVTDEFPPTSRGGSGVVAWREAQALADRGYQVMVFTPASSEKLISEKFQVKQIGPENPVKRNAWQIVSDHQFLDSLKPFLENYKPDVVHCHHVTSFFGLATVDWCSQIYKTVVTIHDANWILPDKVWVDEGGYQPGFWRAILTHRLSYNPWLKSTSDKIFKRAKAVIFVSDAIRLYYESVLGRSDNFITLHNALELGDWPYVEYSPSDPVRLGFAGRMNAAKGLDLFVSLVEKMNNLGLRTIGSIIGQEDRYNRLLSYFEEKRKLMFEYGGFIKDDAALRSWYASLDASFAGSAYLDPFPNVAMESLAVGRGVIVGPYTGSREIVDDSVGYRMTPENLKDVTSVARELSEAKPFAGWAENCAQKRDGFGMEDHVRRLLDVYCG